MSTVSNFFIAAIIMPAVFSFRELPAGPRTPAAGEAGGQDLTVSYALKVTAKRGNTGKGETYNGGVQTLFVSDRLVRLRMVSLMRTQSIFILPGNDSRQSATVVKESGKSKYKYYLDAKEWEQFNQSYKDATCQFNDETTTLLNYACKKATITLKDGKIMTVYYTATIHDQGLSAAEPVFSCIPGLVLKYEYTYKKGTITYTATRIDHGRINPDVFRVPSRGFTRKEYTTGTMGKPRGG